MPKIFPVFEGELNIQDNTIHVNTSKIMRAKNIFSNSLIVRILLTLIVVFIGLSLLVDKGLFSQQRIKQTLFLIVTLSVLILGALYLLAAFSDTTSENEIEIGKINRVAIKERGSLRAPLLVVEYETEDSETKYRPVALQPYWFDERVGNESIIAHLKSVGITIDTNPNWG